MPLRTTPRAVRRRSTNRITGWPPVVSLSLASEAYFRAAEGILAPRGMMMVARADQQAEFEADADGMRLDRLSLDEARDWVPMLNPATVAYAAAAQHAWDIDTDLLIQRFAREARGNGAHDPDRRARERYRARPGPGGA